MGWEILFLLNLYVSSIHFASKTLNPRAISREFWDISESNCQKFGAIDPELKELWTTVISLDHLLLALACLIIN